MHYRTVNSPSQQLAADVQSVIPCEEWPALVELLEVTPYRFSQLLNAGDVTDWTRQQVDVLGALVKYRRGAGRLPARLADVGLSVRTPHQHVAYRTVDPPRRVETVAVIGTVR